jgi:hypothetical protein
MTNAWTQVLELKCMSHYDIIKYAWMKQEWITIDDAIIK